MNAIGVFGSVQAGEAEGVLPRSLALRGNINNPGDGLTGLSERSLLYVWDVRRCPCWWKGEILCYGLLTSWENSFSIATTSDTYGCGVFNLIAPALDDNRDVSGGISTVGQVVEGRFF